MSVVRLRTKAAAVSLVRLGDAGAPRLDDLPGVGAVGPEGEQDLEQLLVARRGPSAQAAPSQRFSSQRPASVMR